MPGFEEYGDLYEAIKYGRKTVEYRNSTRHWNERLITPKGLLFKDFYVGKSVEFTGDHLKHDTAVFVVGYTKYPRLVADITKIGFNYYTNQLETHIENVREEQEDA